MLLKTSEKKYLYPGMDWESFEEKLDNLSFQKSFWESLKNGVKKCLQFLGILFLLLIGILFWYIQSNESLADFWRKHIALEETMVEQPIEQSNPDASSQKIASLLYEYHQKILKHINQKTQELQLQDKKLQEVIKENDNEKNKCQEILKEIKILKDESNKKYSLLESQLTGFLKEERKDREKELFLKEQKFIKAEIQKITEQLHLFQAQLKEWQSSTKDSSKKEEGIESNDKETQPPLTEKELADNVQIYHYRTLFPPSLLVYLPQNYYKFFIGFQVSNPQYIVKEKYYFYQNFIAKGWYQIRLENWYKREYRLKILYTHPFDLLPLEYKILELTSDYSMPQSIKTLRAFPVEGILTTAPGYGFVELLKREF